MLEMELTKKNPHSGPGIRPKKEAVKVALL
jgi:hypothetical protein